MSASGLHAKRRLFQGWHVRILFLACWFSTAIAWAERRDAQQQDRVIAEIQDDAGEVVRDETRPDRPVVHIRSAGLRGDDATLKRLMSFPKLGELTFSSCS
jgi:hypothetical protein